MVFKIVEVLHGHGKFIETETQGKAFVYLSNRALIKVFSSGDWVDFYAKPLDGFKTRVNAPIERIESFVKEIEFDAEGVYALNLGHVLTVSSDIFDEKYLIDCVGKYFDIV